MLLMTNMYDNDWAHAEYDIIHVSDFPVKNCVDSDCSNCVIKYNLDKYVHALVTVSDYYIGTCDANKTTCTIYYNSCSARNLDPDPDTYFSVGSAFVSTSSGVGTGTGTYTYTLHTTQYSG